MGGHPGQSGTPSSNGGGFILDRENVKFNIL